MAPLSPKAQAVIDRARQGLRPTEAQRARIESALDASSAGSSETVLGRSRWRLVGSAAVGAAVICGAAYFLLRSQTEPPAPAATAAPAVSAASAPGASAPIDVQPPFASGDPMFNPPPPVASASAAALPQPSGRPRDGLAQELALLSRAASALRAGRAAHALEVINEYQRKFPNGVLSVERRAVKAQALCSLKRVTEGRAELAHLQLESPAAARAKRICDAASVSH